MDLKLCMGGREKTPENSEVQKQGQKPADQVDAAPKAVPTVSADRAALMKEVDAAQAEAQAEKALKDAQAKKEAEEKKAAEAKKQKPGSWWEELGLQLDQVKMYWEDAVKKNGEGVLATLSTAWFAFKAFFGKEEQGEMSEEEVTEYRVDDTTFVPEDPKNDKLLAQAKAQLDKVKEEHATWIDLAKSAAEKYELGEQGPSIVLAMARFESGFDPEAKAKDSSATGLGQFLDGTWASFQKSLDDDDPLKGKPATDPEVAIAAIAWYSKRNMEACGLEAGQSDLAARLYETHHEGAAGAKALWKFREDGSAEREVPKSYLGKTKLGIKVETYADYEKLVSTMSSRVQAVADLYKTEL